MCIRDSFSVGLVERAIVPGCLAQLDNFELLAYWVFASQGFAACPTGRNTGFGLLMIIMQLTGY
eukprot:2018825-Amphidinium_carterae.1